MAQVAGIVLAGGRSTRMGAAKAGLAWHGSTLLRRVAGLVARGVDGPVVVVRAPGQALPALPATIELADDARAGRGPLQGLAAGLAAVGDRAPAAYASAVDVPLLHPAFVRRVTGALETTTDVVLPRAGGFSHALAAVYATAVLARLEELLAEDRLRPGFLFERCAVRILDEAALLADRALAAVDPRLDSLLNLNDPGHLEAARARPAPAVTVQRGEAAPRHVHAATLGAAAAAVGLALDEDTQAMVDSEQVAPDAQFPLAAGDEVCFVQRRRRR
ncbi:MAG TPA: molybdenum cofactor guanylyltransferase [Solirubrobacteraceae bacterium]|nr:molybdenum cofactor guanylyltransferase [Solirubrobacteraceae bacterium]